MNLALALLAAAQVVTPATASNDVELRDEAYVAAQRALASEAEDALAKLAARFANGSGPVAVLERDREADVERRQRADGRYLALLGASGEQARADRDSAAAERDRLDAAIRDADRRIAEADPAYGELRKPSTLSLSETQALLRPDEGLILLDPQEDATYVFAVTRDRVAWARSSALAEAALAKDVAKLRESITDDLYEGTHSFDRQIAYRLYDELVRPVEPIFAGKTELLVVSGGVLGTLPLQLLVTDKPADARTDDAAMAETHWLIDRYGLATLPAVSSLRALRCLLVPAGDRAPGCGATGQRDRARQAAVGAKMVVGIGAPSLGPPDSAGRGLSRAGPPVDAVFSGALADRAALLKLPSLPGAQAELDDLAGIFGANAEIETGAAATETHVKRSTSLSGARFVVFSTHGLLAREARSIGAGEPGLVFTPPSEGMRNALDDGVLTMSEAAQLTLSADLVVLSACNTAASDGTPGSSGLSGLARAFFFAGAHSLLVSNWVVSDQATKALIRSTLADLEANPANSRSEALRRAIVKVRAIPGFAAPAFWAPFVLVGTGR